MIYFISAWYNPKRKWYQTDNTWFRKNDVMDFDDISTQLHIFQKSNEDIKLVVLNYAPGLRRFLHRQNVLQAPYWSLFDELQSFSHDYVQPIDYLELEWPEEASFHLNPFIVTVMLEFELYARIYLSVDGTLLSILYYKFGVPSHENVYDDRGFLSSIRMYDDDGEAKQQNYLNLQGEWVLCEYIQTGKIGINPKYVTDCFKKEYDSWEDLIGERLESYLQKGGGMADILVLALDKQHNSLVVEALRGQNLILSEFKGRPDDSLDKWKNVSKALFTDRKADILDLPTLEIYPFENRSTFGASAHEANLYVSLFADNIPMEDVGSIVGKLGEKLLENEKIILLLCTFRSTSVEYRKELEAVAKKQMNLLVKEEAAEEVGGLVFEMMGGSKKEERIQVALINRQSDLIHTMAKTRVFLDLGEVVNNHLCTEAIDAGVPQVNRHENPFCIHKKSGYVIQTDDELKDALDYFLVGLQHWNESLIYYTQLKSKYSDKEILSRWESMKEEIIGEDSSNRPE